MGTRKVKNDKATKSEKIFHLKFDATQYVLTSNFRWMIFSNFVALTEYPEFNITAN